MILLAVAQACATKGDVRTAVLGFTPFALWVMYMLLVIVGRTKR